MTSQNEILEVSCWENHRTYRTKWVSFYGHVNHARIAPFDAPLDPLDQSFHRWHLEPVPLMWLWYLEIWCKKIHWIETSCSLLEWRGKFPKFRHTHFLRVIFEKGRISGCLRQQRRNTEELALNLNNNRIWDAPMISKYLQILAVYIANPG